MSFGACWIRRLGKSMEPVRTRIIAGSQRPVKRAVLSGEKIKNRLNRLVIYFPGYDLRPARYCFPLLRKEFDTFLKIRKVNGALSQLSEGLDPGGTTASWSGHVDWPDSLVETTFVQLGWRDVIKADFRRSWPRTIADAIRSFMMIAQAGGYRAALKSNWRMGSSVFIPP